MTVDADTRQRLLELVYDLLPEAEAAELRGRITAEPELARAYEQARQTANLLGEAAKRPEPKIPLRHPGPPAEKAPRSPRPKRRARSRRQRGSPRAKAANWVVGLAAAVLLLVSLGGYWYDLRQRDTIAAEQVRLRVTGPAALQAGVPAEYAVTTTTIAGEPLPAQIKFAVYSPGVEEPKWQNDMTDENGRFRIAVPGNGTFASAAVLKVEVQREDTEETEAIETRLEVRPERYVTRLTLDRPLYRADQPGEIAYYRSLTLSRFGLAADREMPIHFEILDPGGAVVPDSAVEGMTEHGVGCGAFAIPPGLAGGEYTLVARSPEELFPQERRTFSIRHYRLPRLKKQLEFTRDSYAPGDEVIADFVAERAEGGPAADASLQITAIVDGEKTFDQPARADHTGSFQVNFRLPEKIARGDALLSVTVDDGGNREPIVKTIPVNLGKVEVEFFPEGGDLAGGLENRVYFVARDPLGEPVTIRGTVVDSSGKDVAAEAETAHEGMGSLSFTPSVEEDYRLRIASPPGAKDQPLPGVSLRQKIVLHTGPGVFAAGEPLKCEVRSARANVPLVVAAFCRGVPVGQQVIVTRKDTGEQADSIEIPLAEEIGGVIRLTVYDYSIHPPQPVAERLVYRRTDRRLNVETGGLSARYAPGDRVSMSLRVRDEQGRVVPAVLGVAVVDDTLLSLADDDTPRIDTHFLLTTEVENPEDLEEADFYLAEGDESAAALDLLLGTQGWRRFAEKTLDELKKEGRDAEPLSRLVAMSGPAAPPAMFDNMSEVRRKYEASVAEYEKGHTKTLKALTTLSFFGGLGLMLLVAMLGLMKVVSGIHLWVPAVGVTGCCLLIGWFLMAPVGPIFDAPGAIAFAEFHVEPPEVAPEKAAEATAIEEMPTAEAEGKPDDFDGEHAMPDEAAPADAPVEAPPGVAPPGAPELRVAGKAPDGGGKLGRELHDFAMKRDIDKRFGDLTDAARKELADGDWALERARMGGFAGWETMDDSKTRRHGGFVVRQYRHQRSKAKPDVRQDFTETLFWHPMLIADAEGRANVSFDLSDSITTFRLLVDAHHDGRVGSGKDAVESRIPFNLEPKLPLEVTAGDRIDLPLAVVNDTLEELPVDLLIEHDDLVTLVGDPQRTVALAAEQRGREYFTLDVTGPSGDCKLAFRGLAQGAYGVLGDRVERTLKVVPPGFPKEVSHSGQIDGRQELAVDLPEGIVAGSLEVTLNAFPSALADLQQGLDGMLQEPTGCFEQASTANYPNVLSLQYMQEHELDSPAIARRSRELLKKGYVKLKGYECREAKEGYEWFGADPGHEALTAYGLMQFRDMAEVCQVEPEMIERTAAWLMKRRDGQGGFLRNEKALDSFGRAPPEITDAYITWALSESDQEGIDAEIEHVGELGEASDDPYLVALAALGTLNAARLAQQQELPEKAKQLTETAQRLSDKLAEARADDGHLDGKRGSITRSGGTSLRVETTALAALVWLKQPAFTAEADKAVQWITQNRQGSGGFGSTQATILALKALVEHSRAGRQAVTAGTLIIKRDDLQIGQHAFAAGRQETIVVDGLEANLEPGANKLSVTLTGENKMPYSLDVRYRELKPTDDENCPLRLTTELKRQQVAAGETVELSAELTNVNADEGQPMTIAILGLPAGLEVRPDQLKELKESGTFDYYETRAREVICYWRSLAPGKKVPIRLDLVAAVPGRYTGPASRAYLYYTSEQKQWAEPLEVEITPE
ncbi:MAG TPA: alpha-2-macroglobulin family protein [Thermoguttaceae bacterium]|nr:alpha-2-macroglobulin family protein [Thermoguttaceae bacterium]